MEKIGVLAGDSRDALGRQRFFPLKPEGFLIPGHIPKDSWFWRFIYYPMEEVIHVYSLTIGICNGLLLKPFHIILHLTSISGHELLLR